MIDRMTWIPFLSNRSPFPLQGLLTDITKHIDLRSNQLSKSLPTEIGQLTKLKGTVRLTGNQLTGPIPSVMIDFTIYMNHFRLLVHL